jgi:hypothetical protein
MMAVSENGESFEREPALPISELVINGKVPQGQDPPRLENNRIIFHDGTQLEWTESSGRWFDANGDEIQPGQPFQTNEGIVTSSVSPEVLEIIQQQLREQGEWEIFEDG